MARRPCNADSCGLVQLPERGGAAFQAGWLSAETLEQFGQSHVQFVRDEPQRVDLRVKPATLQKALMRAVESAGISERFLR